MLMMDREEGHHSHTMWVMKPIGPPRYESAGPEDDEAEASATVIPSGGADIEPENPLPFNHPISNELLLCRICESQIPQWYFEKHSETCAETHRLEAEIVECNESIHELRNTIRDLCVSMERSSPMSEYRGMPILSPSSSPSRSSPLQIFRTNKIQKLGIKKKQRQLLDQLEDILQIAIEVAVPSLKEDEAREPIERQRLLSPGSERKISQIRNWSKPRSDDSALSQLIEDAERIMRQKIDNVVRMQNTIRYAEKIWHEWEERVAKYLDSLDEGSGGSSESEDEDSAENVDQDTVLEPSEIALPPTPAEPLQDEEDDTSGASGYAFGGDAIPSFFPTPVQSSPPPATLSPASSNAGSRPRSRSNVPLYPPSRLQTRSSTPSSISSPLALAAPIYGRSEDEDMDMVPMMSLDDGPITVRARKSTSSLLEPRLTVTPPMSPQSQERDGSLRRESSQKRSRRRHSNATLITTAASGGSIDKGPLSPRQPSVAPISRSQPASIKDFEIIKPISKGAFGSVFLAKKKVTGDYYAVKVLKKADMIAKNQITNVKAERMILMKQAESPFVAKLYYTFQSKDNLYLVMEYLNGGDCAALIKSLGSLPEEWTKQYIAEVVLGLQYLHERGVVHRFVRTSFGSLWRLLADNFAEI